MRSKKYRLPFITVLLGTFLFFGNSAIAQIQFSQQAGGFGFYGGLTLSQLEQPIDLGQPETKIPYLKGFEAGVKSEVYRTRWMRGNVMLGYAQMGANEWVQMEGAWQPTTIDLQQIKFALNPFIFKAGGDFFHGYIGGGGYGSFMINQEITGPMPQENYWTDASELTKYDFGLDLLAGIHVWNFDIEFHAQYGMNELGIRPDGSIAKQQFYSITLSYLYVNQHLTIKSCRDHR